MRERGSPFVSTKRHRRSAATGFPQRCRIPFAKHSPTGGDIGTARRRARYRTMRSKTPILVAAAIAAGGVAALTTRALTRHPCGNPAVPEPAKAVDLERYLGLWYELARYDQRFERGCGAVTAEYTLRDDGAINVVNRCRKPDGKPKEARGVATVVDSVSKAKLKVRFFGPFHGDYWILDHADDYGWSIVGEPTGRYLWLLTRDAHPDDDARDSLVCRAEALGYDTSLLVFDPARTRLRARAAARPLPPQPAEGPLAARS